MLKCQLFGWALTLCLSTSLQADNWGHWRGESGNGVSTTATPPLEWSETKNVKWKVDVPGRGSGSPVIWENQVFVTSAVPDEESIDIRNPAERTYSFVIFCYDRESGELIWKKTATEAKPHEGTHSTNSFASASPCTDGKHVYAHFGSRGLYCYTMDGEFVWKRDFGEMATRLEFGEGSSPTLMDDKIIVPWDHQGQSALYALDKKTGETIWKVERDEPTCWATPLIYEHDGEKQIIMNGENYARAYDPETGEELWRCDGQTTRPVASPVQQEDMIFIGSGFRGAFLAAFKPDGQGDIEGTSHVVWTIDRDTPDIASLLISDNRLYYYKGKSGLLSCVNAKTGEPHYQTQRIGLSRIYASPIAANGHVFLSDRDGTTVVIKDDAKLDIVATNSVGETVDATPAPVDNQLFIRGQEHLFCIQAE